MYFDNIMVIYTDMYLYLNKYMLCIYYQIIFGIILCTVFNN